MYSVRVLDNYTVFGVAARLQNEGVRLHFVCASAGAKNELGECRWEALFSSNPSAKTLRDTCVFRQKVPRVGQREESGK